MPPVGKRYHTMNKLPRLALLGFILAGSLAVAHATSQNYSTSTWNGPSGSFYQAWSLTVPSTVDITTSISITTYSSSGGGGNTNIGCNGTYVTSAGTGHSGWGTTSASNAAYNQPAGNYYVSHAFGGAPNAVYGSLSTTLTW